NLKPYKDNVAIFGTISEPMRIAPRTGFTCSDFFDHNDDDGDIDFNIKADRANLKSQPNFWKEGWFDANAPDYVTKKLDFWDNNVQCEMIMFGRTDDSCNAH